MSKLVFSLLVVLYSCWAEANDSVSTTAEIAASKGFSSEIHTVVTEDGYNLTLFRILSAGTPLNQVVRLLNHDIFCSSDDFVLTGNPYPIALLLSLAGCDVWLGNTRGNKYSMGHITYNASVDNQYWNYSFHEIGYYDLPAMTDYILNVTGADQIGYLGVGTAITDFLVMTSTRIEYNNKFSVMYALAPIVFLGNIPSQTLKIIANASLTNEMFVNKYTSTPFIVTDKGLNLFGKQKCLNDTNNSPVCNNIYFLVTGYDLSHIYPSDIPNILSHSVPTCSVNQLFHHGQLVLSGRFAKYDYGHDGNVQQYGSTTPPDYDLTQVTVPISIYYSLEDEVCSKEDLDILISKLTNTAILNFTPTNCTHDTHPDFLYGANQTTCSKSETAYINFNY